MLPSQNLPKLIRATFVPQPKLSKSNIGIIVKRGDDDAVIINHVDEQSPAAASGLREGCEILAVSGQIIHSDTQCLELLRKCTKNGGRANVLASIGTRPKGYTYTIATNINNKRVFSGENNFIDGLELEEMDGQVKIISVPQAGFFHGLRLNPGDTLRAINGIPISSIRFARVAFKVAKGAMIPILTYRILHRDDVKSIGFKGGGLKLEDEYEIFEKLGEGSFAIVKKATHKSSGESYAVKTVNRKSLSYDEEAALKEEMSILNDLHHDHICYLHETFVTINHYHMVTELLEGGELLERIARKSTYNESEARDLCTTLFDAIKYMHSKGVAHRDLKPENLLLQYRESDSEIKIVDLGFAKHASSDDSLKTICGSPGYVAPEILQKEKYGTKCDMWSLGVVVFIMIGGYPPFYAGTDLEMLRLTMVGKFEFDREYWDGISNGAKDLISSLLVVDPRKRADADDILSHPWMKEDKKTLSRKTLLSSQKQLQKHIARAKFKGAVKSILFVNKFAGENAVFSCKNKSLSLPNGFPVKKKRGSVISPPKVNSRPLPQSGDNHKVPKAASKVVSFNV